MRKNSHSRILREKPKEQYLSTVFKSCHRKICKIYINLLLNDLHQFMFNCVNL